MNHRLLRNSLAGAALCAAAFVLIQVGAIQIARRADEAALEAERAALQQRRAGEFDDLRARLERTQRTAQRLRRELADAEAASSALAVALGEADAARDTLRTKLSSVSDVLASEHPFLDVVLAPGAASSVLAASAENRGAQPLAISEAYGWFWVDGAPVALAGSFAPLQIEPGSEANVFQWDPAAHALEFVEGSDVPVRGALCLVYGRVSGAESAAWVEERWFEYLPRSGRTATLRRDTWALDPGVAGCGLANAEPPW